MEKSLLLIAKENLNNVEIEPDGYSISGYYIYLNLTNTGSTSIPVRKFNLVDVIVIYTSNDTGERVVSWIPYGESGSSYWKINRVFNDYINPISDSRKSGFWDYREVIEIVVKLPENINVNNSTIVVFSTINGYTVKAVLDQ